jgi:integrase
MHAGGARGDWSRPSVFLPTLRGEATILAEARHVNRLEGKGHRLTDRLKVHAARHHWAVLALRAGVPVRVVQCQLGHATPTLTLGLYGAFLPSGEDRAAWRARVTSHEARRREAQ